MASNFKRKADDNEIVKLNNVGLSLSSIAQRLGVHHTTVTYRLRALGIPPADTRRSFMEDIFEALSLSQQTWLIDQLGPGHSVKDFVRSLLIQEFINKRASAPTS
ncbi:MAG: hypothetical protein E5Y34_11060 [Mesorhizobium sp.]|uniref:hypothetical protein n=1 Tax=Mesorhizobium sp. TaxID=1871066 RepID=UPI001207549B|nr:hypothetical protein [Mesorhizobium sp.]TIN00987.1 MAG: hypothetical protein E5Y34_11060 [Mesorhizobium sp.]